MLIFPITSVTLFRCLISPVGVSTNLDSVTAVLDVGGGTSKPPSSTASIVFLVFLIALFIN